MTTSNDILEWIGNPRYLYREIYNGLCAQHSKGGGSCYEVHAACSYYEHTSLFRRLLKWLNS